MPFAPPPSARRVLLLTLLLGGAALSQTAGAQAGGDLPLVSVGDALKWNQPQEVYTLRVAPEQANTPLGLEVYSPGLNLNDYANGRATTGYYGDELYGRNEPFESVFTLTGPNGAVVLERRYAATREHAWESLVSTPLPAGTYTLRVTSRGNGKNAFALRTAPGFTVESSDFTVNARGRPGEELLAARLTIPAAWVGRTLDLSNYDGDGKDEIALSLTFPNGQKRPLTVSENVAPAVDRIPITADLVGEWAVTASVQPGTKQYSNSVTLRLRQGTEAVPARLPGFSPPPNAQISNVLNVEVVDPNGRAIPGATYTASSDNTVRPRLPQGYLPVSASVVEGSGNVASPTEVRYVPGRVRVRFVARPQEGGLAVDAVAVLGTARFALTGVPVEVNGRTQNVPFTLTLPPGEYRVNPTALPGATVQPASGRVPDGGTGRVTLEYVVRPDLTLLTSPDVLDACDVAQLTATVRTEFPYRLPSGLKLNLPGGWSSDYPLELRGDLSASTPLRLKVPVRVCRSDAAEATLDGSDLRAQGEARVRGPGGANITRTGAGARVRLLKNAAQAEGGYTVTLQLTVDNVVENLRVVDPLPIGGGTPAVRGPMSVQGPSLAGVTPRMDGDTIVLGRVIPGQYTLTYTLFTDLTPERILTPPDLGW